MITTRASRRKITHGGIFMQHDFQRDERGLTLMELIIVLAVIAIIGAILAPNFMSATDRARLKSDIESVNIIQAAIATYDAEQTTPIQTGSNVKTVIIPELVKKGYLNSANSDTPQTNLAEWAYGADSKVKLDIGQCPNKIKIDVFNTLTEREQAVVTGGIKAAA